MLRLYNTALLPLRPAAWLWSLWKSGDDAGRREWAERRALSLPSCPPGGAWIHGASVGEARIVGGLTRLLRPRRPELPLAVSAYTPTGRSQLPAPPEIDAAFYVPLDLPGLAGRLLGALQPSVLALVETELWPNLLHETHARGIPVVVLNGRLSERRMARYRRLGRLYRPLLQRVHRAGVQSEDDAARFRELGVPADVVEVTGSVKYDLPAPEVDPKKLGGELQVAPGRPVLVAGSTGQGEDAQVLEAFEQAREASPELLLLLAPRHPERFDDVLDQVRRRGLRVGRRSAAAVDARALDVLLIDSVGELSALYGLADVAFVGGSLVPIGGHNLLEPAAAGVPVLYGPHTQNVGEPARILEAAGAGLSVADAAELGRVLRELLSDAGRRRRMATAALEVIRANRGALARNVELLLDAVDRGGR